MWGQMGERGEHGKDDIQMPGIDRQQLKTALHGKMILKTGEMQSTLKSDERLRDKWETLDQKNQATTPHQEVFDMKHNVVNWKPAKTTSSLQHQWMNSACPVWVHTCMADIEEQVSAAKESLSVTEVWDDYTFPANTGGMHASASISNSDLGFSSFSDNETQPEDSLVHFPQTGWHFSTGPGLTKVVHCPLLQFPSMSYYPPLQHTMPFEVVWRVWEEVNESRLAAEQAQSPSSISDCEALFDFTVMSYNILAQDLLEANQPLYSHCPLEVLNWSHRCQLIKQEILKWMPEITCLQEVQQSHYEENLHPFLSHIGYKCVYKRRTGIKTDGCATCYRSDRFSEISASLLEFLRPETEILDRDNVAVVLLLQPVAPQGSKVTAKTPHICVANTHLLFNPRRGDVKLAQLAIVLAEVSDIVNSCKSKGEQCDVILCGDFNSVPHTPLYQFITTGQLYYHGLPACMVSGQEDISFKSHHHRLFAPLWPSCLGISAMCQYISRQATTEDHNDNGGKLQYNHDFLLGLRFCPAACVRPLGLEFIPNVTDRIPVFSADTSGKHFTQAPSIGRTLSHGLNLRSVYQHILPVFGHPEVTTLHSEVGTTVDYIFYTPKPDSPLDNQKDDGPLLSGSLKLVGYLSLLSEEKLWSMKGLPNHHFPSDHLSLLAKFQLDLSAAS